ncbi:HNH endonuclease signature motif containing protein [Micromonospora carbonacea]|uniref:HNH endonuclease signature motif containing protein n=1 Tax=Micromonospora carbonacea TaxID=47853 RepID=UPI0033E6C373
MTHVTKGDVEACWIWTGSKNHAGYGSFSIGRARRVGAHRWAYENLVGAVPAGLDLDHLCRVRACVNPAHLEPVTRRENLRRGVRTEHMAMRTHCPQGHPYDEANTGRTGTVRWCRACKRDRNRQRRQAQAGTLSNL